MRGSTGETGMCRMMPLLVAGLLVAGWVMAGESPAVFPSPGEGCAALGAAFTQKDTNAITRLFGSVAGDIENPDPVQRVNDLGQLADLFREYAGVSTQEDGRVVILLGKERWPYPVPLVKEGDQWRFDALAGKEELLNRRVGRNELSAIEVCHAYVEAQREYSVRDCSGSGTMEYARHFRSSPGTRDGLYWEVQPGEASSPFGPLVAQAQEEGYYKDAKRKPGEPKRPRRPFHGYCFKVLKKQGPDAPGGAYDYLVNGHMVAGFALLAYPAEWGNSGIMTFLVNQRGKVYQKNLGEKTGELAPAIDTYNPDASWSPVE